MRRLDTGWYDGQGPLTQGRLPVDPPHDVSWTRCGNPAGLAVVVLDSPEGPAFLRGLFDPARVKLIMVRRRGSDSGLIENNTLAQAVTDLDAVRRHLNVKRWIVAGQGRGATLGLRYAQTYPGACAALLLTGIMLGRHQDTDWWWQGPEALFPEIWHAFRAGNEDPASFRDGIARRCFAADPAVWRPAALEVMRYEAQISDIRANPARIADLDANPDAWAAQGRINLHYDINRHFLDDNALIGDLDAVRAIPAAILHGRYDSVAAVSGGYDLAQAWPQARFTIVPGAGHGWRDEQMYEAVMAESAQLMRQST